MPNFYAVANVDGRDTDINFGAYGKDSGMVVRLYHCEKGSKRESVFIRCHAFNDKLTTIVYVDDEEVGRFMTER